MIVIGSEPQRLDVDDRNRAHRADRLVNLELLGRWKRAQHAIIRMRGDKRRGVLDGRPRQQSRVWARFFSSSRQA
jgi:hypothetical protein